MNISFDNLSKKYYKKQNLSYYNERIFDITNCQSIVKLIYKEPTITIHGTLDPEKFKNMFCGWNSSISKKYLRLFS